MEAGAHSKRAGLTLARGPRLPVAVASSRGSNNYRQGAVGCYGQAVTNSRGSNNDRQVGGRSTHDVGFGQGSNPDRQGGGWLNPNAAAGRGSIEDRQDQRGAPVHTLPNFRCPARPRDCGLELKCRRGVRAGFAADFARMLCQDKPARQGSAWLGHGFSDGGKHIATNLRRTILNQ